MEESLRGALWPRLRMSGAITCKCGPGEGMAEAAVSRKGFLSKRRGFRALGSARGLVSHDICASAPLASPLSAPVSRTLFASAHGTISVLRHRWPLPCLPLFQGPSEAVCKRARHKPGHCSPAPRQSGI